MDICHFCFSCSLPRIIGHLGLMKDVAPVSCFASILSMKQYTWITGFRYTVLYVWVENWDAAAMAGYSCRGEMRSCSSSAKKLSEHTPHLSCYCLCPIKIPRPYKGDYMASFFEWTQRFVSFVILLICSNHFTTCGVCFCPRASWICNSGRWFNVITRIENHLMV